jgi:hypothetical protein
MWKAVHAQRADKRASNRKASARILTEAGIPFESRNGGAHLIVSLPRGIADFWPGTGKWRHRGNGRDGRGVLALVEMFNRTRIGGTP